MREGGGKISHDAFFFLSPIFVPGHIHVTRDCRFCRRSITDVARRSCHTTPGNVAADDSEDDDDSNADDDDDDGGDDDDASLL